MARRWPNDPASNPMQLLPVPRVETGSSRLVRWMRSRLRQATGRMARADAQMPERVPAGVLVQPSEVHTAPAYRR